MDENFVGEIPEVLGLMPTNWATVVTAVTSGMSDTVDTITGNPVLLLSIAVPFVGACIGLAKRLLRFGGRRG